ncbi:hypothetical protein EMPS_07259 [Entomortierella parvispora]|uniref:Uncharacterized protein n=1 Tax=Entomortierella parvispora TaxID=205924 RepID=A0A9P3HDS9_9FUNG|nr:hypothetical protein EMPS_07259 [Entomortierella parvispora]
MSTYIGIPEYRGAFMGLDSALSPSSYFSTIKIDKWSLHHFLGLFSDEEVFMEGLSAISQNKKIDVTIRSFASSLYSHYSGPLGSSRRNLSRKVAANAIKRASVTQTHLSVALTYEEALVEQEGVVANEPSQGNNVLPEAPEVQHSEASERPMENNTPDKSPSATKLGKRRRIQEDEPADYERPTMGSGGPFQPCNEDEVTLQEEDPIGLAQSVPGVQMNIIFDMEDYAFMATSDGVDFGEEFTDYYEHCQPLRYDAHNLPDFVALSGILFLDDRPTSLQKKCFGAKYDRLLDLFDSRVKYPTPDEVKDAIQVCRDAKDAYQKASLSPRRGVKCGRDSMQEALEKTPRNALRSLLLYGSKLHQQCSPLSETDQTSNFILGTLSHIFDRPDETRLAHTASAPVTGSVLLRVYFDVGQLPRHPDVIVKYQEKVDIGVGEVSLSASFQKDQGDLARVLMWSKRAADEIATRYENVEDVDVVFLQIIGQKCDAYLLHRIGTVCVAARICTMKILYTLSDALSFEDEVIQWITLEKTFSHTATTLNGATHRREDTAPPSCFVGLKTPRSRNMSTDANKDRL